MVQQANFNMEQQKQAPITIDETQGKFISVVGDTYRIVLSGAQTNGAFAVIDMLVPPNGGPGPHAHPAFHESFYVLDGEIEVKSEAGTYTAKKGATVEIPTGGIVHGFKNKTDTLAHLLCTVVPAGLDDFFLAIGKPVNAGEFLPPSAPSPEEVTQMEEIAKKYGQTLYPPDYLDTV